MGFYTKIEQKPHIIQAQFSQNVKFFMGGKSSLFCCFLSNIRTQGEISDIIRANNPILRRQLSQNVTFSMRGTWPKHVFLLIN